MKTELTPDRQQMLLTLQSLFIQGNVIELRTFTVDPRRFRTTHSGYFNDSKKLIDEAVRLAPTAVGMYITINPVNPALIARSANKCIAKPDATTSDRDTAERRWLPIDIDPERPSEISSTDDEKAAAQRLASDVMRWLHEQGWPSPVIGDSANGSHLLYRIDLPNDDESKKIIESCLKKLSERFSIDGVAKVDTSVFNASRIWKLYGTPARKGDNVTDRPWRVSRMVERPETIEVVPVEKLLELAGPIEQHAQTNGKAYRSTGSTTAEEYLREHGHQVTKVKRQSDGNTLYQLKECPIQPGRHKQNEGFAIEYDGERLYFSCQHDTCKAGAFTEWLVPRNGQANVVQDCAKSDDGTPDEEPWPDPLGEAAYRGLAGDIVRKIEPHSEADPAALLVQFLLAYGNVIGRNGHFVAEADYHHTNLFAVMVGATSKGRKGSSWGHVRGLMRGVDPDWYNDRLQGGLASGEGLIHAVRDEVRKCGQVVDEGVKDKRLFAIESEFASVMKVAARERNIVSEVVRQAWDSGRLRTMTKHNPTKATDAHITILGHITRSELKTVMSDVSLVNGLANRFLWVATKRSKVLPEGGGMVTYGESLVHLGEAIEHGKAAGEIRRDGEARKLWREVYPELSEGEEGLIGGATSRAEAQVMRLAMLYALLARRENIALVDLQAALEVWRYAYQSARWAFGVEKVGTDEEKRAAWIRQHGGRVTPREYQQGRKDVKTAAEAERQLTSMVKLGLCRVITEAAGNGRTVMYYETA